MLHWCEEKLPQETSPVPSMQSYLSETLAWLIDDIIVL